MKDTEFRAWDSDRKRMFESGRTPTMLANFWKFHSVGIVRGTTRIMQFIGVTDDDGVRIFESDIIISDHEDGIVTGRVQFGEVDDDESIWMTGYRAKIISLNEYEANEPVGFRVIGNAYANPELLEGK